MAKEILTDILVHSSGATNSKKQENEKKTPTIMTKRKNEREVKNAEMLPCILIEIKNEWANEKRFELTHNIRQVFDILPNCSKIVFPAILFV